MCGNHTNVDVQTERYNFDRRSELALKDDFSLGELGIVSL